MCNCSNNKLTFPGGMAVDMMTSKAPMMCLALLIAHVTFPSVVSQNIQCGRSFDTFSHYTFSLNVAI